MTARYTSGGIFCAVPRLSSTRIFTQSTFWFDTPSTIVRASSGVRGVSTGPETNTRARLRDGSFCAARAAKTASFSPPRLTYAAYGVTTVVSLGGENEAVRAARAATTASFSPPRLTHVVTAYAAYV